jgi:CheY-specific phosphatase CheX
MDVKFINPFINATLNVLETMAFVKSKAGKPYLKKDNVARGDVSGIIGITGETNGTIYVTFDEPCILKIVSNMFIEKMTEINNEITDAVGELTNMISGQARKELEDVLSPAQDCPYFKPMGSLRYFHLFIGFHQGVQDPIFQLKQYSNGHPQYH